MSNKLVIIFHDRTCRPIHKDLNLNEFGESAESSCIAISILSFGYWQKDIIDPDILIIKDGELSGDILKYILKISLKKEQYYIAYHKSDEKKNKTREKLNKELSNGKIIDREFSHSKTTSEIYRKAHDLYEYIGKGNYSEKYNHYLNKLLEVFKYDDNLEKKLEILHSIAIDSETTNSIPDFLNNSETRREAWKEFQEEFQKMKNTEKSDSEYNKQKIFNDIVSKLRDKLLDENGY
jgi:hypothetical protein